MPRGSPFTQLCQLAARAARPVAADLHVHTTASDGELTSAQVVAAARAARLTAVAITDHDTTAGIAEAIAAAGDRVRVVPGVEVSAELEGREVHVLGLFIQPEDPSLRAALAALRVGRRERFWDFVNQIPELKPSVDLGLARLAADATTSPGRRHVAGLLLRSGVAKSWNEAFYKFLAPLSGVVTKKPLIPFAEAVQLIRDAGGVASLAHPWPEVGEPELTRMRDLGLQAVEAKFPAAGLKRTRELIAIADKLGLAITGGSDCHSADTPGRSIGACGITAEEFQTLKARANAEA